MEGLLLPICSIFFSLMLIVIYYSKKRIALIENRVFSTMLICSVIDSIIVTILQCIALNGLSTIESVLLNIFNKIDFLILLIYANCVLLYTILITIPKAKDNIKKMFTGFNIVGTIIAISVFLSNIDIITEGTKTSVVGPATTIVYIVVGLYLLSSILIVLINHKKTDKRHIPIYSIIGISLLLLLFYKLNPYLIIVSITLTFLNYIMYFTIENPDMKMINELNIAKEKAELANTAKSDFLSSMSHEIRTPLNAIVGFSETIADANDLASAKENAKDIVTASQTLLELVNGILDISKIESNKMEIINKEYDLKKECSTIAKLIKPRIGEKPIELRTYIAPDIPDVLYGDKGKIKEIITNILTNAVKYTQEGYIEYKVSCINKNDLCTLVISIEDSGRGIKPENINKLFNKFERMEEDRNTTIEGAGLGLAITKKLVEMMGGKIIVQSVYGSGSKFTVYLQQRIVDKPKLQPEQPKVEEKLDFSGRKILLVDDNEMNIKVAETVLRKYDLKIESCTSGTDCVDKIKEGNTYDLILLDDMMPKVTGTETLHILKELPNFNIKTVVLTANAIEGTREKYLEEGFDDYLSKPMERPELERVFKKFFNKEKNTQTITKNKSNFDPIPTSLFEIEDNVVERINNIEPNE